jgi:capsular exopolysaccharide synthesis family protein
VSIVDRARVLDLPTHPKKSLNLAIGLIAAIFGAGLTAFLKAGLDPSIRTLEDVKMVTGLQNIATLPASNGTALKGRPTPKTLGEGTLIAPNGLQKYLLESPLSPQAEAIRNLHASITLGQAGSKRVFMVCSAAAAEGKTTLAVNLAISLARHSSTCLVDADLRRPSVAHAFGLSCEHGLGDVLTGSADLANSLVEIPEIPNLTVLPTNQLSTEALQFVDTFPFDELLRDLRAQFKYVVVDTSPLVPFADSRALAPLVDGLVLVGRYGVTNRSAISRCVELLGEIHSAPIVQFVMNGADVQHSEYGYYA